jgi:Reverse transcriptase (RNA-dependent DNA polymerase)
MAGSHQGRASVLWIKKNAAGEIEKYKACLVARGFTQVYGVDYYETYTPVAKLAMFWLITMITARNGWPLDSFNFDSAYLNSLLGDEVIYLKQPPDHNDPAKSQATWVWKLIKTIYGLHQGAKNWYDALTWALTKLGFKHSEADHGLFFKEEGGNLVILAIHVDDCLMTGGSVELNAKVKKDLNAKYKLTDLGPANWLLSIRISHNLTEHTVALSQHAYIDSILMRFNDLKPSAIPMDPSAQLLVLQCPMKLEDLVRMHNVPYHEAVGSLMYAAMGT